jgi:hypothetical protein
MKALLIVFLAKQEAIVFDTWQVKNYCWGKIEHKLAKLLMMAFAFRSTYYF